MEVFSANQSDRSQSRVSRSVGRRTMTKVCEDTRSIRIHLSTDISKVGMRESRLNSLSCLFLFLKVLAFFHPSLHHLGDV